MQILVEGPSKKNPARYMGRTRCNKIVIFAGSEEHRGQLMDMKRSGRGRLHSTAIRQSLTRLPRRLVALTDARAGVS